MIGGRVIKCMKWANLRAATVFEMMVVVGILGLLFVIGAPYVKDSKSRAGQVQADSNAKVLNEAIQRAIINGDTNPVLFGNDVEALAQYLVSEGWIRP